jgi:hypothetical protein
MVFISAYPPELDTSFSVWMNPDTFNSGTLTRTQLTSPSMTWRLGTTTVPLLRRPRIEPRVELIE